MAKVLQNLLCSRILQNMFQTRKKKFEQYGFANLYVTVINTDAFKPDWTTHASNKYQKGITTFFLSAHTERLMALEAWPPSPPPLPPYFSKLSSLRFGQKEVSEKTCHPAEHNWVSNLWPCIGWLSLFLRLCLSGRDTCSYAAAGLELDWIKKQCACS